MSSTYVYVYIYIYVHTYICIYVCIHLDQLPCVAHCSDIVPLPQNEGQRCFVAGSSAGQQELSTEFGALQRQGGDGSQKGYIRSLIGYSCYIVEAHAINLLKASGTLSVDISGGRLSSDPGSEHFGLVVNLPHFHPKAEKPKSEVSGQSS